MKKILKTSISIITIFFTLMTIFAYKVNAADTEGQISMQIESDHSVKAGEEITIKISLSKNDIGILGIQGKINYDKNAFELVDKKVVKNNWYLSAFNEESDMFMIEVTDDAFYNNDAYIYDNETILEVTLKAKQDSKINKTEIQVTDVKVVDSTFQTLDVQNTIQNIRITGNGLSNTLKVFIICAVVIILVLTIYFSKIKNKNK